MTLHDPWGSTQAAWGAGTAAVKYTYTGQEFDPGTGLLYYRARYYDPVLGRFISPDPIVPEPGNPQALNRYAYVYNNPLKYTDPSGHCPVCIPVAVGVLKLVDYGWTAWDTYQAGRTLADPKASDEAKLIASLNIALAAGLELLEPDDLLPASLPLDDIARRSIAAGAHEAMQQGGLRSGVQYLKGALGEAAPGVIRHMYDQGMFRGIKSAGEWADILAGVRKEAGLEVHHLIEQRFAATLGLNADDIPSIVLTREEHQAFTNAWREKIGYDNMQSVIRTSSATSEDIWMAARSIYQDYPELLEAVRRALGK